MSHENGRADPTIGELDLLEGAEAIAVFLFGNRAKRRTIYHLVQMSGLPVFKMGSKLCARRSTLIAWIERQEDQATKIRG